MTETRSIKIRLTTYRRLKVLAALAGETMMELIDRMALAEEHKRADRRAAGDSTDTEPRPNAENRADH